jgi:hypothetical protein
VTSADDIERTSLARSIIAVVIKHRGWSGCGVGGVSVFTAVDDRQRPALATCTISPARDRGAGSGGGADEGIVVTRDDGES